MLRTAIIGLWCCLALGCASVAERQKVALAKPTQAAQELECMGECLEDAEMSCEDCAARCFSTPQGVILTFSR
jgi:hypothetical protein